MDRVVHVSFGLDVGGQEKLLVELARHADRSRFTLMFVSLGERGALAGDLQAWGGPVVALGKPSGLKPSLIFELARWFRRWRADVVHTHDQRSLIYAAPAAWLAGVPRVIHTRHGRDVGATPRGRALIGHLSRLVDHFVCVSGDIEQLSVAEGIAPWRLRTIRNGIDLDRFAFSGPHPGGPVIAVARLSPEKDLANLVRAAAIARQRDPDLRIEIAGDGPCLPELRQLVAELGLEGRVALLGEVDDVAGLLARGGLFVLPSRSEGIALTLLEAMARGLPVVATRVGGTPEVVLDGQTGLLVPSGDPAALAEAILRLRRDPERGEAMGRAARQRAEERFDVRRMVADYETLYREAGMRQLRANPSARAGTTVAEGAAVQPGVE
jgi:sugar transferase (PEP-CTERM/EpsH1 system associated)